MSNARTVPRVCSVFHCCIPKPINRLRCWIGERPVSQALRSRRATRRQSTHRAMRIRGLGTHRVAAVHSAAPISGYGLGPMSRRNTGPQSRTWQQNPEAARRGTTITPENAGQDHGILPSPWVPVRRYMRFCRIATWYHYSSWLVLSIQLCRLPL